MPGRPNPSCSVQRWMRYHYGPGSMARQPLDPLVPDWSRPLQLPPLRDGFGAGRKPGAALSAPAGVPAVTSALLQQRPEDYFRPMLRRLAHLQDPVLTEWVATWVGAHNFAQMPEEDVFSFGNNMFWTMAHPHTSNLLIEPLCMPYQWHAVRRTLPVGASAEQREQHHYTRVERQGAYLKVQLGTGVTEYAHRLLCALFQGPEPPPIPQPGGKLTRYEVSHTCGNSACLNPEHLRWATPQQNAQHGKQCMQQQENAKQWRR